LKLPDCWKKLENKKKCIGESRMELEKEKKYLVINTSGIINYNIKKYKKMKQ
jgi:hypothetical protein